ncbi:SCO6880 family protein [Rhodococcus wratislaviensis]|uniref:SCO6880 family protein n=1 Tax=Rhodococcus wratislaviensis TaxID=44752 RepID=UPI00364E7811
MSETPERRTYGGWHEPSTTYIGGIGKKLFYTFCILISLSILGLMIGLWVVSVPMLLTIGLAWLLMAWRYGGRSGYEVITTRVGWRRQKRGGSHILRAGALSNQAGGRVRLPGVAANIELWWGIDALGRKFAMMHLPTTHQYTIHLRCTVPGFGGAEQSRIDLDVANWGEFINLNGQAGDIDCVATTIEWLPETGARAESNVADMCAPGGSPIAQAAVRETITDVDSQGLQFHARMSITWRAKTAAARRDPMVMLGDLAQRIPAICRNLAELRVTGVPMSDNLIAAVVRRSYDPRTGVEAVAEQVARTDEPLVSWLDAGPVTAEETKASYFHDGAVSRTWEMHIPPRGKPNEQVLRSLLEANAKAPRKRITLLHRPLSPADAAAAVERSFLSALTASNTNRGLGTARGDLGLRAAEQTRREEADGAGVTDFSLLVTATADSEAELNRIAEDIIEMGQHARIGLRPCYRYQAAAFLGGLAIGVLLPDHASTPKSLQA